MVEITTPQLVAKTINGMSEIVCQMRDQVTPLSSLVHAQLIVFGLLGLLACIVYSVTRGWCKGKPKKKID